MSDINEMSDKEKSLMLLELMGVVLDALPLLGDGTRSGDHTFCRYTLKGKEIWTATLQTTMDSEFIWQNCSPNLYDPANMALLATVMAWFASVTHWEPRIGLWANWVRLTTDDLNLLHLHEWMCESVDEGIRLAIETGLVKEN